MSYPARLETSDERMVEGAANGMEFSEQALILAVRRFREIDAWVRLLSPVRGVYTAFAFGGMKSRRRFLGCLDPLNHVQFKVRRSGYRSYHCLTEGRLLDSPRQLRTHPQRLGMAVNCLKFFEAVPIPAHSAAEAYALLRALLAALDAAEAPSSLVPLLFRARMTFLHGMLPVCAHCAACGRALGEHGAVCHVEEGKILCPACRSAASGGGRWLVVFDQKWKEYVAFYAWGQYGPVPAQSSRSLATLMDKARAW